MFLFGLSLACREAVAGGASDPTPFPWTTYEAEEARTNATVQGPSRVYRTPESEASGRKYVRLDSEGQFVEFTVRNAADGLVLRYCIPDSPQGGGIDSSISLSINGRPEQKLPLTSRHVWSYGDFPWSNDPGKGNPHHFFDEVRARIPKLQPGDTVRLQKGSSDGAAYYLIDLIELEEIPPAIPRPPDTLSISDFGAISGDGQDDSVALLACIAAAKTQGKGVWVPEGEFQLDGEHVPIGGICIKGAGVWYSCLTGQSPMFSGAGEPVLVSDLAVFGDVNHRNDTSPDNAFDGNLGDGSVFRNLWIEHLKCGFWTTYGTRHMRVENCRIRNTMADGLNFCDGTSFSVVEHCHLRNTGDDALATWSTTAAFSSGKACVQNAFVGNRIELPWHANGLALYGGANHLVAGNTVTDTVMSGAGLLISSGFEAVPFSGTIRAEQNTFIRTGGPCYIGEPVGGLWIHAKDSEMEAPIRISGLRLEDSTDSGLSVHGPKGVKDLEVCDTVVERTGSEAVHVFPGTSGTLRLVRFAAEPQDKPLLRNESADRFTVLGSAPR